MLCTAFVFLFFFPGRTEQLWAWTMRPDMTPINMGAGYLGGAWFFTRVAFSTGGGPPSASASRPSPSGS